ncbi:MFS transporter [Actinomadura kijaniata]|uniref:ENTS family enterobactin (Siderophore) exporter n=1 Tax=Actinomadura namibiensis TaxID=182080 RepID=A0A7W3QMF0_ACTNM|nr:enterobactin transporter EntS [Actinomadura namibiensis]MBA8952499.1 ENTS family enterobactin (siderophore) exporter [Actinomadura namibiensis]
MRPSSVAMDLSPLRASRDYRLFFAGFLGALFGTLMTAVAVSVQVYEMTGSPTQIGLTALARAAPMVAGLLAGGVLADRYDRRALMLWTRLPLAGVAAALAVNALLPEPRLWVVYAATAVTGLLAGLGGPALLAATPALVGTERLAAAGALTSASTQLAALAAPAVGGLLVAGPGPAACYAVDAAGYLVFSLAMLFVRPLPPAHAAPDRGVRQAFAAVGAGLRFVRRDRLLLGMMLVGAAAMVFTMPQALYPVLADRQFGSPGVTGLLYAAPALGALLGAAASGWTGRVRATGYVLVGAVLLWGGALVGFGLSPALPAAVAFLALAGLGDFVSETLRGALLQHGTPDELRGRVSGLWMVQAIVSPALGNAAVGFLADLTDPRTAVVSGGAVCVVAAAAVAVAFPALRRATLAAEPADRQGAARR